MKIDEYVPRMIPMMSVRTNHWMLALPRKKSEKSMMSVEPLVKHERFQT
jgi:hypothetical protein